MKKPGVNIWALIYYLLILVPVFLMGLWAVKDGWFPSERVLLKHPDSTDPFYSFNQLLAYFCGLFVLVGILPIGLMLSGPRKPWVWTALLIFICFGFLINPLAGIPILLYWIKENNKQYYGFE